MIKIGTKKVNKIVINNKEVLKIIQGDGTSTGILKYQAGSTPSTKTIVLTPSPSTGVSYISLNLPNLITMFNNEFFLDLDINDYYNYQTVGQGSFVFKINRIKVYNYGSRATREDKFALSTTTSGSTDNNYMQTTAYKIPAYSDYEITESDMIIDSNKLVLFTYPSQPSEYLYRTNGYSYTSLYYKEVEIELVYL